MNIRQVFSKRLASLAIMCVMTSLLFGSANPASAESVSMPFMSVLSFDGVMEHLDFGLASAIVASDAVIHTPEGDFHGPAGAGRFAANLHRAFSSTTFITEEPRFDGEVVTVRWTMYGMHTGQYLGLAPACASVRIDGIALIRFEDMQIVEQWVSYDRLSVMDQISAFNATAAGSRPGCEDVGDIQPSSNLPNP